jgi:voltage-gated potassium channel
MKRRIWEILDGDNVETRLSKGINVFILLLIFANVIAVAFETVEGVPERWGQELYWFEAFSVAVFSLEYLLRLWTCPEDSEAQGQSAWRVRLAWVFSPMAVIDLLAVAPFFVPVAAADMRSLRALRLLRFFRVLKLGRYSRSLRQMQGVFKEKKEQLFVSFFVLALCVLIAATGIYYLERDVQPEQFSSIPQSMWWAVTTLSTVGYGDTYPITEGGRVFGAVLAILGIGVFGVPAGIIASGFVSKLEGEGGSAALCPCCGANLTVTVSLLDASRDPAAVSELAGPQPD